MSYSKLHSSIVNSSLWTESDAVRILFITLLALCDRDGYVYGSRQGLERAANILSDEQEVDPWYVLMSPDPDSSDRLRNPENEGRRIEEVSGGFRLLNFSYYRGLRNDDDRREQNRQAQERHRAKKSAEVSQDQPASAGVSQHKPISEADTDPDINTPLPSLTLPGPEAGGSPPTGATALKRMPRVQKTPAEIEERKRFLKEQAASIEKTEP